MKKRFLLIFAGSFCVLTIFQIALLSYSEPIKKLLKPVEHLMTYFLWPGIVLCLVLPWSPELYATYPGLLAFPITVNSVLYTGLFACLFMLAKKLRVQLRSI